MLANLHTNLSGQSATNFCFKLPQPDVMRSNNLFCGVFYSAVNKLQLCDWRFANYGV
jgi:hypothetical protein